MNKSEGLLNMPTYTYEDTQKLKKILESLNAFKYEIVRYLPSLKSGLYYIRKRRKVKHKGGVE